ncbi:LysR family transcriptional regulator [Inquilinus limosus]|uniref:HTH lysR-type domain-containing protein n=1 Tax=Inquilinus limosus TaxID=171674 RepID=A0A211ZER8_9PROT|nr:LysR family transcriptional regulator [Inquilinus limosus]OWJ63733.1 hypothetical protein BWR60_28225 [Inquilinus limosus]
MTDPDLRSIRYATVVAEHLSFRRAANALGIRQSAISRRVRRLEDTIGVSFFERHSGGLLLTNAGRTFIRDARRILSCLDRIIERANREGRAEAGRLTIGFFPSLVSGRLQTALRDFRRSNPDIVLEMMEGSPVDQLEWLRARRIDAGLLAGGYEAPKLERLPLWKERIFAAVPQDHDLAATNAFAWQDLRHEQLLIRSFESGSAVYNFLLSRIGVDGRLPNVTRHVAARENILGLVGAGFGITFVPESQTAAAYPGVVFRPIAGDEALLSISAAWLAVNDNPALRRFLSVLRQARPA